MGGWLSLLDRDGGMAELVGQRWGGLSLWDRDGGCG